MLFSFFMCVCVLHIAAVAVAGCIFRKASNGLLSSDNTSLSDA